MMEIESEHVNRVQAGLMRRLRADLRSVDRRSRLRSRARLLALEQAGLVTVSGARTCVSPYTCYALTVRGRDVVNGHKLT